jgi:adenylyltransferase/sulfurtransferase
MLAARRSCALLSRGDLAQGKTPTTPTTASIIAGIQCQEAVKWLHGLETLVGRGFVFEGLSHQSYVVSYTRKDDCPSHDPLEPVQVLDWRSDTTTARQLWERARADLGPGAIVEFQSDLLSGLECPHCAVNTHWFSSLGRVTERDGLCPRCGAPRIPHTYHSLSGAESFLDQTLESLGVPAWEVMTARVGARQIHYELAGDASDLLGPLAAPPLPTGTQESP